MDKVERDLLEHVVLGHDQREFPFICPLTLGVSQLSPRVPRL